MASETRVSVEWGKQLCMCKINNIIFFFFLKDNLCQNTKNLKTVLVTFASKEALNQAKHYSDVENVSS